MYDYIIIFPGGDRTKIDIANCASYERDDYAMAYEGTFTEEKDAILVAKKIALTHNLIYNGKSIDSLGEITKHNYLYIDDDNSLYDCQVELQEVLDKYNCDISSEDGRVQLQNKDEYSESIYL